jgi:hypothetical protein
MAFETFLKGRSVPLYDVQQLDPLFPPVHGYSRTAACTAMSRYFSPSMR